MAWVPAVTLAVFLLPILAGLLWTAMPAFGLLPVLGGESLSLEPWRALFADPSLPGALRLSLVSGLGASLVSLALAIAILAAWHDSRWFQRMTALLSPLLALPHAALAFGLLFVIAPSGLLLRLVSPWLTGLTRPPDLALAPDPEGLALLLGLVLKETPFLLFIMLAALARIRPEPRLRLARSLGYGSATAWLKTVLPALYPQIRLPFYAVVAYGLSVVDMAIILAPANPPTLAVLVVQRFADPDLQQRFVAAAGALLQLGLVILVLALIHAAEHVLARLGRWWIRRGGRRGLGRPLRWLSAAAGVTALALSAAAVFALLLWSLAGAWRFPEALPSRWSLGTWEARAGELLQLGLTSLLLAAGSALIALALTLGCLENERRRPVSLSQGGLWLLYLPLLLPQSAFLFGVAFLALVLHLDGSFLAVLWSHLLFVLPYVFLTLADPFRRLDERYARTALCLGASPNAVFWRVRLPMLRGALWSAFAVGFAVSIALYLPTLFLGAGRLASLTTEAVGLAAGGDRRAIAATALLQSLLPLLVFAWALARRGPVRPRRTTA